MTHILQRGDTAATWAFENPVLMEREVGWETDTLRQKLGDGVSAWNDLPYVATGGGGGGGAVSSVNGQTGDVVLTKASVGLANANNTSDLAKPISNATQTALDGKAPNVHSHGTSGINDGAVTSIKLADGAVSLTGTKVSGVLPVEHGGTGVDSLDELRDALSALEYRVIILPAAPAGVWTEISTTVVGNITGVVEVVRNITTDTIVEVDWRLNPTTDRFEVRPDIVMPAGTYSASVRGKTL